MNIGKMKYPFWCFVIALIYNYGASGDINIYPGSNYYLPHGDSLTFNNIPFLKKRWSSTHRSPVEEYEETNQPTVSDSRYSLRDTDIPNRNSLNNILKFLYRKHAKQIEHMKEKPTSLPRSFQEIETHKNSEDYSGDAKKGLVPIWLNEDIERSTHDILRKLKGQSRRKVELPNEEDETSFDSSDLSDGEQQTSNQEDTTFAFIPPDPRYYETRSNLFSVLEMQPIASPIPLPTRPVTSYGSETQKIIEIPLRRDQSNYGSTTRRHFIQDFVTSGSGEVAVQRRPPYHDAAGVYIIAVVAGISAAATVGLIAIGIGWYNLQKHVKNASDVEYPAYGVTGPNKDVSPSNDRRLAQSAQMYHYQHQKQQIIAMEKAAASDRHGSVSEIDSDEENEEGDYTVYECPGLAPTGEMEVKNPLYQDDPTPAQTFQAKLENKQ